MLFHLFRALEGTPGVNVFNYPSFRVIISMLTSLAITYVLYPWFIRQLQKRQIGQVIREELTDHQSKKDTPTMGGILLIFAVIITTLLWSDLRNPLVWIAVSVTFVFSLVGFVDDAMKLGERGSKGLSERGKLLGQFGVSFVALGLL
ncbi:MAG: phospho-N-acetylmuramoyl-pentapeptide-transferase, partial [Bradymonadia bacterium]